MSETGIFLIVSVKALIKNSRGEYLFLKRVRPFEGEAEPRWDVPGGKLVPGEPIYESLAREIFEETKLVQVGEPRILEVRDNLRIPSKHSVRLTFEVSVEKDGPIVIDKEEHTEYEWLLPQDMLSRYHDVFLTSILEKLVGGSV